MVKYSCLPSKQQDFLLTKTGKKRLTLGLNDEWLVNSILNIESVLFGITLVTELTCSGSPHRLRQLVPLPGGKFASAEKLRLKLC